MANTKNTTKKKGVLTGPDPDDAIVYEMLKSDYSRMSPADRAKFDMVDAANKKTAAKKTAAHKK